MAEQSSWEEKFNEIQKERDNLKNQNNSLQKQNDELKKKGRISKSYKIEHSHDFWKDIRDRCHRDPDSIKLLVKDKKMTLNDTDKTGKTLLCIAACYGFYEVAQFCINSGADIDAKSDKGKTALMYAKAGGYYHIEQLILFSKMNLNIGNEIKNTSETMHKQNGTNNNILNELSLIGEQSKELFEKILMELMINIITKKLLFSDNLLNYCWHIVSRNNDALSSDLWKAISSTCSNIIQNGSKRDWHWLKTCIIPSTIWFKDILSTKEEQKEEKSEDTDSKEKEGKAKESYYLYYELLKLVDIEAQNQLNKLENDLNALSNENKNDWIKLTQWDIPTKYEKVRQDVIPNGIVSRYTYNELSESSGATFNSPKFYDYNQYLSQLVLLAQIVDEEFQQSIQDMFNTDKVTNEGTIILDHYNEEKKNDNHNIGDGSIKYMRGPVKKIERARSKAENDYVNEAYPASACILDLNRCTLIFNDISTLLAVVKLFVNKVKYYQSGNIIGIVRNKNGFVEYIKETQYADIKLNVLIKGKHNNIIGEVQFLLKTMKQFKDKAHNLYAIQRQQEVIETSVSKILPMLLDDNKQLFVAGNTGNVKLLCKLMVFNNKTIDDIMQIDQDTGQTILHRICSMGHDKALLFLKSILSKQSFIEHIFRSNGADQKCIEYAVKYSKLVIVKHLFEMKEIKEKYKDNNDLIFRLCYFMFSLNKNKYLIDYLLSVLKITNEKVQEMMTYKYPMPTMKFGTKRNYITFHRYHLITQVIKHNKLAGLQKLVSIIGEKVFINNIFIVDDWNKNGLEIAFKDNKIKIIQYILSFKEIKDKYLNDNNLLFRLIIHLFAKCGDENTIDYVVYTLQLTNDKIISLMDHKYLKPSREFGKESYQYHRYTICSQIVINKKLNSLKKLVSIIGENKFVHDVFVSDDWNKNAVEYSISKNSFDLVKYILSFKPIKIRYSNDMDLLFRLMYTLFVNCKKHEIIDYVLSELNIPIEKVQPLMTYKYPTPTRKFEDDKLVMVWHNYSIIAMIIFEGTLESLKKLVSIIGNKSFFDGVFYKDGWNRNAFQCGIKQNRLDIVKYLISINDIKEKLIDNKDELWTIIAAMNVNYNVSMATFVINALGISKETLNELKSYKDNDITNILNIVNK